MAKKVPTPVPPEQIPQIVTDLRNYYFTNVTRPFDYRKKQMQGLVKCLDEHRQDWVDAMASDMGSHSFEANLLIQNVRSEIIHTIDKFTDWLSPESASNPWSIYPGSTKIIPEPYGVVCDFIPYNYPMYLGFSTILPILAAGNVCLFKPSSNTPACAYLYQTLFPQYLDPKAVKVVCGPTAICSTILEQRFDFIFYTGSPSVGKTVMAAASRYLTPVLLELGGKSPVYVDKDVKLEVACKRLLFGKIFNGGQTCVAPDYALVHKDVVNKFKEVMLKTVQELYGDVSQYNDNITHIISERHFDRITRTIETSGGNIIVNGMRDKSRLYIGPTIIENPGLDSQIMTEEIFGPVLPFITVQSPEEAIEFINRREKPLALYVFTSNDKVFDKIREFTSSGAIMQNDVVFHVSSPYSPFGGVGNSGMGQYHGKTGVLSLSHPKPVLTHSTMIDVSYRYPPYKDSNFKKLKPFV